MRLYVDADIIIDHLRGRSLARQLISRFIADGEQLWVAATQRAEVLFHLRRGEEAAAYAILAEFTTQPLTEAIVDVGAEYYRRWHPSHGTGREDALLAGTVALTGGRLVTQNIRHFPMPDIDVQQGWPTK